jgi:hypothetical protein
VRTSWLVVLGLGFAAVGCGGSGGAGGTAAPNLAGAYGGTWTDSQGGASLGPSTLAVNSLGNVTIELGYSASGVAPNNITGTVDPQGNFSGDIAAHLRPQPITGTILAAPSGGISATLTYILTPGAPTAPHLTWYINANRQ